MCYNKYSHYCKTRDCHNSITPDLTPIDTSTVSIDIPGYEYRATNESHDTHLQTQPSVLSELHKNLSTDI